MSRIPDATERERMAKFLADPDMWPMFPRLPLKNTLNASLGVMFCNNYEPGATQDPPYIVVVGNLFTVDKTRPQQKYDTVDDLVDAGWVVD